MGGGQSVKNNQKTQESSLNKASKYVAGSSAKSESLFNASYSVSKTLGSGAFSVVKLVTHQKTKEKFAVKIVNLEKLTPEVSMLIEFSSHYIL